MHADNNNDNHIEITSEGRPQMLAIKHNQYINVLINLHKNPPVFNVKLLSEALQLLDMIDYDISFKNNYNFLIWNSINTNCFSLGGDLKFFLKCIEQQDRSSLEIYANNAVEIIYRNQLNKFTHFSSISYVDGKAFGGGLEFALSANYLICSPKATFLLPEVRFGSFPGMGAVSFLARRIGQRKALEIIKSNSILTAKQAFEIGIVDAIISDKKEINICMKNIVKESKFDKMLKKSLEFVPLSELKHIVDIWVDDILSSDLDRVATMKRMARIQGRHAESLPSAGYLKLFATA